MRRIRVIVKWDDANKEWVAISRFSLKAGMEAEVEIPHFKNGFSGEDQAPEETRIVWRIKQKDDGELQFPKPNSNPRPLQIFKLNGDGSKGAVADGETNPDGSLVFQNLKRHGSGTFGGAPFEKLTIDVFNRNDLPKNSKTPNNYGYTLNLEFKPKDTTKPVQLVQIDPMIANYGEYD